MDTTKLNNLNKMEDEINNILKYKIYSFAPLLLSLVIVSSFMLYFSFVIDASHFYTMMQSFFIIFFSMIFSYKLNELKNDSKLKHKELLKKYGMLTNNDYERMKALKKVISKLSDQELIYIQKNTKKFTLSTIVITSEVMDERFKKKLGLNGDVSASDIYEKVMLNQVTRENKVLIENK